MGQIPVLQIGDFSLFESGAICAYLSDLHFDKGLAPSLTSPDRGEYQKWMYFAASTLDPMQAHIMIIEDIPAGEVRTEKETKLVESLENAANTLDKALAKSSFLVNNRFSTADICVSYHLYWLKLWPELDAALQKFPRVVAYVERMKNHPTAVKAKVFSYEG